MIAVLKAIAKEILNMKRGLTYDFKIISGLLHGRCR